MAKPYPCYSQIPSPVIPALSPIIPALSPVIPALSPVIPALSPVIPALSPVIPALSPVIPALSPVIPAKAGIHKIAARPQPSTAASAICQRALDHIRLGSPTRSTTA